MGWISLPKWGAVTSRPQKGNFLCRMLSYEVQMVKTGPLNFALLILLPNSWKSYVLQWPRQCRKVPLSVVSSPRTSNTMVCWLHPTQHPKQHLDRLVVLHSSRESLPILYEGLTLFVLEIVPSDESSGPHLIHCPWDANNSIDSAVFALS